jgi:2-polyprenyl-3-methyl-5-hydroxy-6-metoxy-1,4-benzoquinol methylase
MKKFWNERYAQDEFAYGTEANHFLKEQLVKIPSGKILFPAEGEGRNAVYAATKSWNVTAFDISEEGKKKAEKLAKQNGVSINYQVGELENHNFAQEEFDVIALIYAHFPGNIKEEINKKLNEYLKPNGTIIFEAFSKNHLSYIAKNEKVGGPREIGMLYSMDEIKDYFPNFEILMLEESEIELEEGLYHNGLGSVIRFVGRKK